jgi:putative transcriptional regulator
MARTSRAHAPDDARPGDELADPDGLDGAGITIHLDELLAQRGMTLTELADRVGITVVNLSVLKNGRARAIRFSTLAALCTQLGCQPGDLLSYQPGSGS